LAQEIQRAFNSTMPPGGQVSRVLVRVRS
jgi:hypothetical protein